ncbi:MAG TPA: hypothetical protein VGN42_20900 [Pirellulales bacterium]|jgi:hypothetical protein|nr:hypothetical protein [Pirellulales bacterium]
MPCSIETDPEILPTDDAELPPGGAFIDADAAELDELSPTDRELRETVCSATEGDADDEFDEDDFDDDFDDDFEDELDEELNDDLDEFDEDIEEGGDIDPDAEDDEAAFDEEG